MKFEKFIAHRGAKTYAPENTIDAFQRALNYGVNWMELDVQMTRDNELIIFHDYDAERVAGSKKCITNMTLKEVKTLNVGKTFLTRFAPCRVPTLKEYLEWMQAHPEVYTNVEIKVKPYEDCAYEAKLVQKTIEVLNTFPELESRILLSSFSQFAMKRMYEVEHNYALEMLVWFRETDDWDKNFAKFRKESYEDFKRWGCCALGINGEGLTESRVEELKDLCGTVLSYSTTTFSENDVRKLLSRGIDSVFIDEMNYAEMSATEIIKPLKIGFLATGDEITTGDIQNTNTPALAAKLYAMGYKIGMHLACYDSQRKIEKSLSYLLDEHDIVFTVGGLGPTEDDKTRQAISYVVGQDLVFDGGSWQRIVERIQKRFKEVPENNRQQAYFPDGSKILPNANGTADGCIVTLPGEKYIVMLPGPPSECLGMFEDAIIPFMQKLGGMIQRQSLSWQLMGASEADISQKLKPIADRFGESLGYRAAYPYLEVKLHTDSDQKTVQEIVAELEVVIEPYLVTKGKAIASERLLELVQKNSVQVKIKKDVTKGMLYSQFSGFEKSLPCRYKCDISTYGLEKFWQDNSVVADDFKIEIKFEDQETKRVLECDLETSLFLKGQQESLTFVYEWVCWQVVMFLEKEEMYA